MKNTTQEFAIDTKTDALRIVRSFDAVIQYLRKNDVLQSDVIWDYTNPNHVRVIIPQWESAQQKYSAAKQRYCDQYGCN